MEMKNLIILALSVVLASCSKDGGGGAAPVQVLNNENGGPDSVACKNFIASLPSDYMSGFVEAPEDPNDKSSPSLQIFYYGKIFSGVTPVAFFNGGPTSSSWGSYGVLSKAQKSNADYAKVPFIFIDQRGTGCSTPYPAVNSLEDLDRLKNWASTATRTCASTCSS